MTAGEYEWPTGAHHPGDAYATVRVVVTEHKPGGRRWCFTNFRDTVTLAGFREYIVTNDRLKAIDVDHPDTVIEVETRMRNGGARVYDPVDRQWKSDPLGPWCLHAVLKPRGLMTGPDADNLTAIIDGTAGPNPDGNRYVKVAGIDRANDELIPDGPAKFLRLLVRDFDWTEQRRRDFLSNVDKLATAIESGQYTFDPFVLSLIRAGVVAKLKELNW